MKTRFLPQAPLELCALCAITAVGVLLRVWEIGDKGLWLDEAFSVWLGWQPLPAMIGWIVRIDQHPPLYYALLHAWMKLAGDAPTAIRMLSTLFGAATIPVIALLGRRLVSPAVGLLAALIVAISPFHVRFAQEARMYSLLMLNASLGLLALTHILTDSRRAALTPREIATDPAWLAYIVCCAAVLWSHNTAILYPAAINLWAFVVLGVGRRRPATGAQPSTDGAKAAGACNPAQYPEALDGLHRPSARAWISAQLGVLVLWLPWLVPFIIQSAAVYREFWVPYPTWLSVIGAVKSFLSAMLPIEGWQAACIWIGFGSLIALGIWHLRRRAAVLKLFLVILLTPMIGQWVAGLWRPIFDTRALIWAAIPLYLLLAAGIAHLRLKPAILAAVALLVTVNSLSLRYYFVSYEKEGWDQAAAYVGERAEPEDLLLFNATWAQLPFDYYFRFQKRPVSEHGAPVDLFDRGVLEPRMAASDLPRLHNLISDRDRVWLIYSHSWYTDPEQMIPTALEQDLRQIDERRFNGLELRLYERR
jgi:uncharacterized membrane protein